MMQQQKNFTTHVDKYHINVKCFLCGNEIWLSETSFTVELESFTAFSASLVGYISKIHCTVHCKCRVFSFGEMNLSLSLDGRLREENERTTPHDESQTSSCVA